MIPGPISTPYALFEVALNLFPAWSGIPPAFDPNKPIKNWLDPSPVDNGSGTADYTAVIPGNSNLDGTVPFHAFSFFISLEEAKTVNVMSDIDRITYRDRTFPTVPVPRRPLVQGESLRLLTPSGPMPAVYVVNDALYAAHKQQQQADAGQFTQADRDKLNAIAAKVLA